MSNHHHSNKEREYYLSEINRILTVVGNIKCGTIKYADYKTLEILLYDLSKYITEEMEENNNDNPSSMDEFTQGY